MSVEQIDQRDAFSYEVQYVAASMYDRSLDVIDELACDAAISFVPTVTIRQRGLFAQEMSLEAEEVIREEERAIAKDTILTLMLASVEAGRFIGEQDALSIKTEGES